MVRFTIVKREINEIYLKTKYDIVNLEYVFIKERKKNSQ